MRAAGFEPRVRIPTGDVERLVGSAQQRRGVWEHRCPVCQMSRVAGRPVREWRCASCLRVGLEGGLIITRRAEPLSQVRT
jgi:ribosomal protein L37AE/L43A